MSSTREPDDESVPGLLPDGRADPAYAAALGLRPAGPLRRSLAFALDAAIWVVLSVPLVIAAVTALPVAMAVANGRAASVGSLGGVALLAVIGAAATTLFGLVQLILHGRLGITVGKAAAGLRSVNVARFTVPRFWRVVLRVLVLYAAQVVLPIIGPTVLFASGLWDAEHRGRSWLDRIGRTWVVQARGALDPLDTRAMRQARRALDAPTYAVAAPLPSLATGMVVGSFTPGPRLSGGVIGAPTSDGNWQAPEFPTRAAETPRAPAAAPSDLPPRAATATLAATLVFDDGTRVPVTGSGVIGRNPEPSAGESIRHVIPLEDPSMRISKTHASFGIDADGFWVLDRGSTNGTVVETAGRPTEIAAGERTRVPWGGTVTIGGRSFSVAPAEGDA